MQKKNTSTPAFTNSEFLHSRDGRGVRVLAEFLEPSHRFHQHGIDDTIVFFGSARTMPRAEALKQLKALEANKKTKPAELKQALKKVEMSRYHEDAEALAEKVSLWNKKKKFQYAICSGGGPGIMEAANKGAHNAKAPSIGLNIHLPFEQQPNPYISSHLNFEFHYFFLRKFWFVYMAKAIIVFPGGFGTLDEMMEVLTLVQTNRITKKMVFILYGKEFWNKVLNFEYLVETGMISEEDLQLFKICDKVDEAFDYLTEHLILSKKKK